MSTPEYRIDFSIQRREEDEEDFTEIGFGSSGAWDDLAACTHMIDSGVSNWEWETEPGQPDPGEVRDQIERGRSR